MPKQEDSKIILYAGGLAILYFGVIRPILKKLGIQQTQEEKEAAQAIIKQENTPNNENPFSSIYWKNVRGAQLIDVASTDRLNRRIYNAMGYFSDDESAVYSVFTQLKYKTQVSWLADNFQRLYKIDLFDFLKRGKGQLYQAGLNNEEMQKIIKIVNALPKTKQ